MAVIVEVTLISAIDKSRDRKLGIIIIENNGTGDIETGNYHAVLKEEGNPGCHICYINGFNRKDSVFYLICRILNEIGYNKQKPETKEEKETIANASTNDNDSY